MSKVEKAAIFCIWLLVMFVAGFGLAALIDRVSSQGNEATLEQRVAELERVTFDGY